MSHTFAFGYASIKQTLLLRLFSTTCTISSNLCQITSFKKSPLLVFIEKMWLNLLCNNGAQSHFSLRLTSRAVKINVLDDFLLTYLTLPTPSFHNLINNRHKSSPCHQEPLDSRGRAYRHTVEVLLEATRVDQKCELLSNKAAW